MKRALTRHTVLKGGTAFDLRMDPVDLVGL